MKEALRWQSRLSTECTWTAPASTRSPRAKSSPSYARPSPADAAGGSSPPTSTTCGRPRSVRGAAPTPPTPTRSSPGATPRAGAPNPPGPPTPARAARRLAEECPGLRIAGTLCPEYGFEREEDVYAEFRAAVAEAEPDLVFVGLGFPKQEKVITRLREDVPGAWFMGCGAAVNFVA